MPEKLITLDDLKLVDAPKAANYLERLEALGRTADLERLTVLPTQLEGVNLTQYENAYITGDFEDKTLEETLYDFNGKNLIEDPNAPSSIKNNGFLTIYYLVRQIVEFGPPFNVENVLESVLGNSFKGVSEGTLLPATIETPEGEEENPEFKNRKIEISINNDKRVVNEADYVAFISKYPHVFEIGQTRINIIEALSKEPYTTVTTSTVENVIPSGTALLLNPGYEDPPDGTIIGTHFVDISSDPNKNQNQKLLLREGYVKSSVTNSKLKDGYDTIFIQKQVENFQQVEEKTFNLDQTEFKGAASRVLAQLSHHTKVEVLAEGFGKNAIFSKVRILDAPNSKDFVNNIGLVGFVDSRVLKRYSSYINEMRSYVTIQPDTDFSFDLELPKIEVPEPNESYIAPDWTNLDECEPYLDEKENTYNIALEYKTDSSASDYDIIFKGAAQLLSYYGKKSNITLPPETAITSNQQPVSFVGKLLKLNNGLFATIKERWSSDRQDKLIKYLVAIPRTYFEHPSLEINEFRAAVPRLEKLTEKTEGLAVQDVGFWWIIKTNRLKTTIKRLKKIIGKDFKRRATRAAKDGYALVPEPNFDEDVKIFDQVLPKLQDLLKLNDEKLDLKKRDVLAIGFDQEYRLKTAILQRKEDGQIISKYLRKGINCFGKEEPFSKPNINAYLRYYPEIKDAINKKKYHGLDMVVKFTYPPPEIVLNEASDASKKKQFPTQPKTPKEEDLLSTEAKTYKTKAEVQKENEKLIDPVLKEKKYEERRSVQIPNNDSVLDDFEALQRISNSEMMYDTVLNKVNFEEFVFAAQSCVMKFIPQAEINLLARKQTLKSLGYVDLKKLLFNSKFQADLAVKCQVENISPELASRIELLESEYDFYENKVIYSEIELAGLETGINVNSEDLGSFVQEQELIVEDFSEIDNLTTEFEEQPTNAVKNLVSDSSAAKDKKDALDKELTNRLMGILKEMGIEDCVLELLDEMSGTEISAELDAQVLGFDLGAKLKASTFDKTLEAEVDDVFKISVAPPTFEMAELPMDNDDPLLEIDVVVESAAAALVDTITSLFKSVMTEFLNTCADIDLGAILSNIGSKENNANDNLGVDSTFAEDLTDEQRFATRSVLMPPTVLDGLQTNKPGTLDIYRLLRDPRTDIDIISHILETMNEIPTTILTSEALELMDELSLALRPSEVCAMLLGTAKSPIYKLVLKIVRTSELENIKIVLSNTDKIKAFFKGLGMFIDLSFCIELSKNLSNVANYCENKLQDEWYCQQLEKKGFSKEECEQIISGNTERDKRRLEALNDLLNDELLSEVTPILCAVGNTGNESILNTPHMEQMADSVIGQMVDGVAVKFDMEVRGAKELFVDVEHIPGGGDLPRQPQLGRDYLTTNGLGAGSYSRALLPPHLDRKSTSELEEIIDNQTKQPDGAPEGFVPEEALEPYLFPADGPTAVKLAFEGKKPYLVDFGKQSRKSWPRNDINKRVVNKKLQTSLKIDNSNILSRSPINIIPNMLNGYKPETEFLLSSNEPAKRHFTMIDNHKLIEANYSTYLPVDIQAKVYTSKYREDAVQFLKEQYINFGEDSAGLLPQEAWDETIDGFSIDEDQIPSFLDVIDNYIENIKDNLPYSPPDYIGSIGGTGFAAEEQDFDQILSEGADLFGGLNDDEKSSLSQELQLYLQKQYGPDWSKLYYYSLNLFPSPKGALEKDIFYTNDVVMLPYIEAAAQLTVNELKENTPETSKLVEINYPKYIQLKANDFIQQVAPKSSEELKSIYSNIPLDQIHFRLYNHNSNFTPTSPPANSADNIPFEVQLVNVDLNFRLGLNTEWLEYIEDFSRAAETKNVKNESGLNIDDIDTAKRLSLQQYLLSKVLSTSLQDLSFSDKNLQTNILLSTFGLDTDGDGVDDLVVPMPEDVQVISPLTGRREKFEKSCLKIYDLVFASAVDRMLKNIADSEIFNIDIFDKLNLSNNTTSQQFLAKICFPQDGALAAATLSDILNSNSLKQSANEAYKDQLCKTNLDSPNDPNVLSKSIKVTSILAFMRVVILENIIRGLLIFASFELSELLKNNIIFAHILAKSIEKSANEFVGDYYTKIVNVCFDILVKELTKGKIVSIDGKKLMFKSYKKSEMADEYNNISSGIYNVKFILKTKAARKYLSDVEQSAVLYVILKQIDEILGPLSEALETPIKEKISVKNAFLATEEYMDVPYQLTDYSHFLGNSLDTFLPWRWLKIPADQEALGKIYLAQAKLGNIPEINLDNWLANLTTKELDIPTLGPVSATNVKSNDMMIRKILQKNNSTFYQTQWSDSEEYTGKAEESETIQITYLPGSTKFKKKEDEDGDLLDSGDLKYDIRTNLTSLGDATKNGGFVIQKYLKLIPHKMQFQKALNFKACFNFGFDGGAIYNRPPWELQADTPSVGSETGWKGSIEALQDDIPPDGGPIQDPDDLDESKSNAFTSEYEGDLYWAFKSSPESIDIIDNTLNYENIHKKDYVNLMIEEEGFIVNINALDIAILNSLVGQNFDLDDESENDFFSNRFTKPTPDGWTDSVDYLSELELLGNLQHSKLGDYFRDIKIGQRLVYVFPHNMDIIDDGPYGDITAEQLEVIEKSISGGSAVSPKNEKFKLKNKKFIKQDFVDRSYILDTTDETKDIADDSGTLNGSFAGMLGDSLIQIGNDELTQKCFSERKYRTAELVFETATDEQKKTLAGNSIGNPEKSKYTLEKEANIKRIYSIPIGKPVELTLAGTKDLKIRDILDWYVDKQDNTGQIENLFFGNDKRSFIAHKIYIANGPNSNLSADEYMTNKLLGDSEKKVSNLVQNYIFPDKVLKTMALMHVINFPKPEMAENTIFKASKQASVNLINVSEEPQNKSFIESELTEQGGAPAKFKEELDKLSASKSDNPIVSYFQKLTPRFIMRYLVSLTDPAWAKAFEIQKQTGASELELFTKIMFSVKPVPLFPIAPFGITPPTIQGLQNLGVLPEELEEAQEEYNEFIRLFWPFGDIRYPITGLGMTYLATGYVEPFSTYNQINNPDIVVGDNIPIDQMGSYSCEPGTEGFKAGQSPDPQSPQQDWINKDVFDQAEQE